MPGDDDLDEDDDLRPAFEVHADFEPVSEARVYRATLLRASEECAEIVRLASGIGAVQAQQSADPGLNRVLRVPVNGTGGSEEVQALRLELLKHAFDVHARACEAAGRAYGVEVAPPPRWRNLSRGATVRDRLLANVTEWNRRVKFNANVLKYTTEGGNVGTTPHRDESPLAYVVPLRRRNATGGGTEYLHLPRGGATTLNPPSGTLVLHPGDATHRGVPIGARDPESGPGERWIIAGFVDTKPRRKQVVPEPSLTTRRGDLEALAGRWGAADLLLPVVVGCHVSSLDRVPRYRQRDGRTSPLRLGARRRSVYVDTTSSRSGRDYRYYVTPRCRKQGVLASVLRALKEEGEEEEEER